MAISSLRTALFVPGNQPERIDKAFNTAADAVVIDLEDAVPAEAKSEARVLARDKIRQYEKRMTLVRVNGLESGCLEDDLEGVAEEALDGIILPKAESRSHIQEINDRLTGLEEDRGLQEGSILVVPLIESARGVESISEIVSESGGISRLYTVAFGAVDFALDLGIELTKEGTELSYARSRLPIACRAAGIKPPLDTPFIIDINDLEAFRADARRARQFGFQGKLCIHPKQVEPCNEIFSPTEEEIAFAKRVIRAFDDAQEKGVGAIQVEGKMIDTPVAERCREILKIAASLDMV
ncbi:MAG: CoA ester lyase [Deltaproteobacteria bacterium]|nr:CoA ester lyase [Deltaproteobacteria bacterium]MBW2053472.1 CoA ester lyase [Deltaproteobacteria bacterium]MBW2142050.1 CoA ester lyase [Deltaproteobacteria bacterium]MBW2323799.1 CoA ester lyase [Deltaproteobacteria bacterium]